MHIFFFGGEVSIKYIYWRVIQLYCLIYILSRRMKSNQMRENHWFTATPWEEILKITKCCLNLQNAASIHLRQKGVTKKTCRLKSCMKGIHPEDQRSRRPRERHHSRQRVARSSNLRRRTSSKRKYLLGKRRSLRISEGLVPNIDAKAEMSPNEGTSLGG